MIFDYLKSVWIIDIHCIKLCHVGQWEIPAGFCGVTRHGLRHHESMTSLSNVVFCVIYKFAWTHFKMRYNTISSSDLNTNHYLYNVTLSFLLLPVIPPLLRVMLACCRSFFYGRRTCCSRSGIESLISLHICYVFHAFYCSFTSIVRLSRVY